MYVKLKNYIYMYTSGSKRHLQISFLNPKPHHITSHTHHITYTSHHITSHHITSHHITSHHITYTSHHITYTSHHITIHHITSHHITYTKTRQCVYVHELCYCHLSALCICTIIGVRLPKSWCDICKFYILQNITTALKGEDDYMHLFSAEQVFDVCLVFGSVV